MAASGSGNPGSRGHELLSAVEVVGTAGQLARERGVQERAAKGPAPALLGSDPLVDSRVRVGDFIHGSHYRRLELSVSDSEGRGTKQCEMSSISSRAQTRVPQRPVRKLRAHTIRREQKLDPGAAYRKLLVEFLEASSVISKGDNREWTVVNGILVVTADSRRAAPLIHDGPPALRTCRSHVNMAARCRGWNKDV